MAITSMDQVAAALDNPQRIDFHKVAVTGLTAGIWRSLWNNAGRPAAGGFLAAGSARQCNQSTPAAVMPLFANPAGSRLSYAMGLSVVSDQPGTLLIYDRLIDATFNGASATLQAFTYVDPTKTTARPNDGGSVAGYGDLWLESQAVTAAQSCTVRYVNEAGVAVDTPAFTPSAGSPTNTLQPIRLAGNDRGVRSLVSVTPAASMGGTMGLVVMRRIAQVPIVANVATNLNMFDLRSPRIGNDPCLALAFLPTGASTGTIVGSIDVGQG